MIFVSIHVGLRLVLDELTVSHLLGVRTTNTPSLLHKIEIDNRPECCLMPYLVAANAASARSGNSLVKETRIGW